jgi:metallo-beta-lactamase class B
MYVVTKKGVVLLDTPSDSTLFQPLLDSIMIKHLKRVVMCISTNSHKDRTGGLEYYKSKGIETYTTLATDELSKKRHQKHAQFIMDNNTDFKVGQYFFETYFPGAGYTGDNIVVWFPKNKVLYCGGLIKSMNAKDLGDLTDSNVKEWSNSIHNLKKKFKNAVYVVPQRGDWAGVNLFNHTLDLLKKHEEGKRKM